MFRPTWAEVNLDHISHNITEFRRNLPAGTQILVAVKANGYGHGAVPVAQAAIKAGASYLAVASIEEAVQLRQAGIDERILILGFTPPAAAAEIVKWRLTPAVFQLDTVEALAEVAEQQGVTVPVHIKVDTGMGRIGVQAEAAAAFTESVAAHRGIFVEGIFSHLATADEADKRYAKGQILRWEKLLGELEAKHIQIPLRHIANSAGAIELPEAVYDMVRIGISLYGLYPSREVNSSVVDLRPALSLKSKIVHLKELPHGAGVSYGATRVTRERALIATIPVGYADGYSRLLSGKAQVLVRGQRVPVFGRICMDQCMLDVTDVAGVAVDDEVVLYGKQGTEEITLDEVAAWIGTISYEVACDLGMRVPRHYLQSGQTLKMFDF